MTTKIQFLKNKKIGDYVVRVYGTEAQRYYLERDVRDVLAVFGVRRSAAYNAAPSRYVWVRDSDGVRRYVRVMTSDAIKNVLDNMRIFIPAEYAKRLGIDYRELKVNLSAERNIASKTLKFLRGENVVRDFYVEGSIVHAYLPDYNVCLEFVEFGEMPNPDKIEFVLANLPNSEYVVFNGNERGFDIFVELSKLSAVLKRRHGCRLKIDDQ